LHAYIRQNSDRLAEAGITQAEFVAYGKVLHFRTGAGHDVPDVPSVSGIPLERRYAIGQIHAAWRWSLPADVAALLARSGHSEEAERVRRDWL
jgi:hypothetical protein